MFNSSALFEKFGVIIKPNAKGKILDLNVQQIKNLLHENGVVLFRGFEVDDAIFKEFSSRFMGSVLSHGASTRKKADPDGTVVEVVQGQKSMCLHKELGYVPWTPDLVWFYCKIAAKNGGETTVCDGAELFNSLSKPTQKLFTSQKIKYSHHWPHATWTGFLGCSTMEEAIATLSNHNGVKVLSRSSDEILKFEFVTSAIVKLKSEPFFLNSLLNMIDSKQLNICDVTFENGVPIASEIIDEIRATGENCTRPIEWHDNEIAMIDNGRVLHGRNAFTGTRVINTRFGKAA